MADLSNALETKELGTTLDGMHVTVDTVQGVVIVLLFFDISQGQGDPFEHFVTFTGEFFECFFHGARHRSIPDISNS